MINVFNHVQGDTGFNITLPSTLFVYIADSDNGFNFEKESPTEHTNESSKTSDNKPLFR